MTEDYKQHMVKGREAFMSNDFRKAFEFFNAALGLIKELKDHDDSKSHYYITQECVFDSLERMQDYKTAITRIDELIEEEKAKGDAKTKHIAHFMQRKACLEIKSGNNRVGVKIADEAYEIGWKTKEQQTNYEIVAKIYNEHQRGTKITSEHIEFWQKNHNYWAADKELTF